MHNQRLRGIYGPAANAWSTAAPMLSAQLTAAGAVNGKIYAIGLGGGEVEAYDPATNTWSTAATMPTGSVAWGVADANGLIYAINGPPGVEQFSPPVTIFTFIKNYCESHQKLSHRRYFNESSKVFHVFLGCFRAFCRRHRVPNQKGVRTR